MPSTTSSSVSMAFASSTVMTPSLPTFCMARAIIAPISCSPLAEMVPTWAISALVETLRERDWTSLTTAATAMSMPRFRSIGFIPAATAFEPSRTMACARIVAVVVPSPARSLVLLATSRTICAPMFSNLSASSMSLATVTPSLVMRGAPNDLSRTTLRPLGPRVTRTAFARMSTPRSMRSRASVPKRTSLAAIVDNPSYLISLGGFLAGLGGVDDAHDVGLLHDQKVLAIHAHFAARPLAEQDAVARLDVEGEQLALFVAGPRADSDHFAFHRLFLGGVGDDDAPRGLLFGLDPAHQHPIVKRTKLH